MNAWLPQASSLLPSRGLRGGPGAVVTARDPVDPETLQPSLFPDQCSPYVGTPSPVGVARTLSPRLAWDVLAAPVPPRRSWTHILPSSEALSFPVLWPQDGAGRRPRSGLTVPATAPGGPGLLRKPSKPADHLYSLNYYPCVPSRTARGTSYAHTATRGVLLLGLGTKDLARLPRIQTCRPAVHPSPGASVVRAALRPQSAGSRSR